MKAWPSIYRFRGGGGNPTPEDFEVSNIWREIVSPLPGLPVYGWLGRLEAPTRHIGIWGGEESYSRQEGRLD